MQEVKRFIVPINDTCDMDSYQSVVLASDHDRAMADKAAEIARLRTELDNMRISWGLMHAELEAMRSHVRTDNSSVIAELQAEAEALRRIISECATACGAGVSSECSIEFMRQLPGEIAAVMERRRKNDQRYRWLRTKLVGASFDWDDEGMTVLAFEMPPSISVGPDCDRNIDAAMAAKEGV